jgi:hypothetical protein
MISFDTSTEGQARRCRLRSAELLELAAISKLPHTRRTYLRQAKRWAALAERIDPQPQVREEPAAPS